MNIIDVKVERIGLGTGGIGYHLGKVVFIPFTMPGDVVRAQILENKKNFIRAEVLEILEPSPERVTPPCAYFSLCGGCQWQHIPYALQLEYKTKIVYDRLKSSAQKNQIDIDSVVWNPIVASPSEFRYRHRIRIHKKKGKIGFYQLKSHELVAVNDCLLVPSNLSQKFKSLESAVNLVDGTYELKIEDEQISIVNIDKDVTSFTQVNKGVNLKIHQIIRNQLSQLHPKIYLDLYCGSGNFTFLMHQIWGHLQSKGLGVEVNLRSIKQAQKQQLELGIQSPGLEFLALNTKELTHKPMGAIDFIFVDPPRAGLLPELINWMEKSLSPGAHLMYMSCDPMTLDRDLVQLYKKGFSLTKVWLFDMFAQTDHVESLVLLTKK